jgi:hydrogenase nickel incorporation protein HypA/HybF
VHELALAQAVVETALDTAGRERMTRLTRIVVRIGELQSIERDVFEFALKEVMPASEPRLAGTAIDIEIEPAGFLCRACGHAFALADTKGPADEDESEAIHFVPELAHAFLACPECRSPDFEVTGGRGVVLQRLEGE